MSERVASSIVESLARLEALQKAQRERDEYKKLYTHLREENERLKRGLLGKKAEFRKTMLSCRSPSSV